MDCDYLIIGAGMAGASAAYGLSAHAKVILVEREDHPGYHTTGRSAAFFVETYGNSFIRPLTKASKAFLSAPPAGFCTAPLLVPRGGLHVARRDQLEKLEKFHQSAGALVSDLQWLTSEQAVEISPILQPEYVAGAVLEPGSMDIDVDALHQGYLRGIRANGGQILVRCELTGLRREGRGWCATVSGNDLSARVIINAAGAWGDQVAALAGAGGVGLQAMRRTILTVPAPPDAVIADWPLVIDADEQFYFKPESGRILLSPADETPMAPCDVQPDELDIAVAIERIQTATTLKISRIESRWAGLRTFAPDRSLVIGFDDVVAGFFWCVGQGGYGIQTAPAVARLVEALALEQDRLPPDLTEFGIRAAHYAPDRLR